MQRSPDVYLTGDGQLSFMGWESVIFFGIALAKDAEIKHTW